MSDEEEVLANALAIINRYHQHGEGRLDAEGAVSALIALVDAFIASRGDVDGLNSAEFRY